jgi:hypothetical protein
MVAVPASRVRRFTHRRASRETNILAGMIFDSDVPLVGAERLGARPPRLAPVVGPR